MVKVKYIGDIFPARVKVGGSRLFLEKSGDICDVSSEDVDSLLKNGTFVLVDKNKSIKEIKEKKELVVEESEDVVEEVFDDEKFFEE